MPRFFLICQSVAHAADFCSVLSQCRGQNGAESPVSALGANPNPLFFCALSGIRRTTLRHCVAQCCPVFYYFPPLRARWEPGSCHPSSTTTTILLYGVLSMQSSFLSSLSTALIPRPPLRPSSSSRLGSHFLLLVSSSPFSSGRGWGRRHGPRPLHLHPPRR